MSVNSQTEKSFKHIHQNINGSYLWVVELWTGFTYISMSQFFLTSTYYFYIHIHIYVYIFLILKAGTCYFMSSLSFRHPLLQVELVGLGWDRTSARTQAHQEYPPPWGLLSFPKCHSGNRGHLSNITEQMSGSALAGQFLKPVLRRQVSLQQLPHRQHQARLF